MPRRDRSREPGKEDDLNKYLLKLFITGQTIRSGRAVANLRRIFEKELGTEYELIIIDVQTTRFVILSAAKNLGFTTTSDPSRRSG